MKHIFNKQLVVFIPLIFILVSFTQRDDLSRNDVKKTLCSGSGKWYITHSTSKNKASRIKKIQKSKVWLLFKEDGSVLHYDDNNPNYNPRKGFRTCIRFRRDTTVSTWIYTDSSQLLEFKDKAGTVGYEIKKLSERELLISELGVKDEDISIYLLEKKP
jgi:hypothetical protein